MAIKRKIEVCFSPVLYPAYRNPEAIVLVTDVLRATSAICTAFMNGAKEVIPVETLDEAFSMKQKGHIVAAERDGIKKEFADFGNSPFNFTKENVEGKTIVYSTTNGTQTIQLASDGYGVIIGSFLNLTASCDLMISENRDILILCAGWKTRFNLEDTIHAGAIVEQILKHPDYYTICDAALAALDLWSLAKVDLPSYIQKSAQRTRLEKNNLHDSIPYCLSIDITSIVPIFRNGKIIASNPQKMKN